MRQQELLSQHFFTSNAAQVEIAIKVMQALYISNAGGLVAFLGFLAQGKSDVPIPCYWKAGAALFVLGLVLAVITGFCAYLFQSSVTERSSVFLEFLYYEEKFKVYVDLMKNSSVNQEEKEREYNELKSRHNALPKTLPHSAQGWFRITIVCGFLSLVSFVIGCFFIVRGF